MKVALFTSLAIFAVCGLALADDGFFGNDNGFGIGGLAGGFSSWGGAGYGGGLGGYKGGLGGYGKAQYVPLPLPAQGARGGSGGLGGCKWISLILHHSSHFLSVKSEIRFSVKYYDLNILI